jgi:hypothetical protein
VFEAGSGSFLKKRTKKLLDVTAWCCSDAGAGDQKVLLLFSKRSAFFLHRSAPACTAAGAGHMNRVNDLFNSPPYW